MNKRPDPQRRSPMLYRAHHIAQPRVYGNFVIPSYAKARATSRRHNRPGMSAKHLALLRKLPCCVSGVEPARQVHHLKCAGHRPGWLTRGLGMRAEDRWALPLSRLPHEELERAGSRGELAWFAANGVADPIGLAKGLWKATGDLDRMRKVLAAHMT